MTIANSNEKQLLMAIDAVESMLTMFGIQDATAKPIAAIIDPYCSPEVGIERQTLFVMLLNYSAES